MMKEQNTTDRLDEELKEAKPQNVAEYLKAHEDELINESRPFGAYMRSIFKKNGLLQKDVFISADLSDSYGYKLICEEKHTNDRDTILRICFGAHFTLVEVQRALKLYGMSPLYSKIPRDAVLIIAFNSRMHEIAEVDSLLETNGMPPLSKD